jgi:hypothetical protein
MSGLSAFSIHRTVAMVEAELLAISVMADRPDGCGLAGLVFWPRCCPANRDAASSYPRKTAITVMLEADEDDDDKIGEVAAP